MDCNPHLMTQLLEEAIELAVEDGATTDIKKFVQYIFDLLPEEIIDALTSISGADESGALLEDIWKERFEILESIETDCDYLGCQVCLRDVRLTRHHLYPRETHKTMLKRGVGKEELNATIAICRMCHSTIHRLFTNIELANNYFSLESLLENERIQKYAKWASSQCNSRSRCVR